MIRIPRVAKKINRAVFDKIGFLLFAVDSKRNVTILTVKQKL